MSRSTMSRQSNGDSTPARDLLLPHPAEDLSADDDLLSWVLVDQLGCMPNTKLGVHPQQVKFVGPPFKTDEVLNIVRETVTKGDLHGAMKRLQEFWLFQQHLQSKLTANQKERFIQHLRRYLLCLQPTSRVEIHLTSRYSFVTGHTELAVFATRPLARGLVIQELQGSVVPLPEEWREEMDIGDDFAVEAAEESGSERDEEEEDVRSEAFTSTSGRRGKSKTKEESRRQGQRRSDRTKRRDFSIVWSGLKRCYQLFLGPARFLNHDCNPNVELLRQGNYVTFRVIRPVRIGEELTTFYGENYFGKGNVECLCLTCEKNHHGGFTPKPENSRRTSRHLSRDFTADPPCVRGRSSVSHSRESMSTGLNSLKHETAIKQEPFSDDEHEVYIGLSTATSLTTEEECDTPIENVSNTPRIASPFGESLASDVDSVIMPPRRERYARKAAQNSKSWLLLKGRGSKTDVDENLAFVGDDEEFPPDFPRCATCAKPLSDQIWYNGRYFDHCQRCVRHALVFELPWPAHKPQEVQEYPPAYLIPPGYIPPKISTVPLPSLSKNKPAPRVNIIATSETPPRAGTSMEDRGHRLRKQIEIEEYIVNSLREAAWSVQEAKELAQEAKEEAKRKRKEEKMRLDAMRIKGNGIWQRYEYVDEEELKRKQEAMWRVEPGITRRGTVRKIPQVEKSDEKKVKQTGMEAEGVDTAIKEEARAKKNEEKRRKRAEEKLKREQKIREEERRKEEKRLKDRERKRRAKEMRKEEKERMVQTAVSNYTSSFQRDNGYAQPSVDDDEEDNEDLEDEIMVAAAPELLAYYSPEMPKANELPSSAVVPARPLARRTSKSTSQSPLSSEFKVLTSSPQTTISMSAISASNNHAVGAGVSASTPRQAIMLHIPARHIPSKDSASSMLKRKRLPGTVKTVKDEMAEAAPAKTGQAKSEKDNGGSSILVNSSQTKEGGVLPKEDNGNGKGPASHSPKSTISAMGFTKQTALASQGLPSGRSEGYLPPPFPPFRAADYPSVATMAAPGLSSTLSRPGTSPGDVAIASASSPSDASLSLITAAAGKDATDGEPLQGKLQGLVQNFGPSAASKNNKRRLSEDEVEATSQLQLPPAKKKRTFFPSIFQHPMEI
ncbi:histone-lysine N-methyltransferase SUV420H [Cryptococcus neoformans Ze90-1]|nr:histone-lysine N-methyltransferase SUV420H [Cryptococcus neoformans var. grubii Ze90-1]